MAKEETAEQLAKRQISEEKEMKWLLREQSKENKSLGFFIYMMIMLCIIYVIDEFTSNVLTAVQTQVLTDFYPGIGLGEAQSKLTFITFPAYLILIVAPFYKSLADRFGRRAFLALNVVGMVISLFIIMVTKSLFWYVIGSALIQLFVPNDVQVMYIMECAPEKKRGTLSAIAKGVGLMSITLVSLLRSWVFNSYGAENWRIILYIPVIAGFVVAILSFITIDETPVFLERRINYLRMTPEERSLQKESSKKASGKTIDAFKLLFKNKQLRWVMICGIIFAMSTGVCGVYESIMTSSGMSVENVTKAIFIFPMFNALITCFSGFFLDKLGRKRATIVLGSLAVVALTLFLVSAHLGWSPYLVGIFYGCFLGGLWQVSDTLFLYIPTESTPTEIRASVLGALSLIFSLGCGLAMVIRGIGGMFFKDDISWFSLAVCVPLLALSIILLMFKVKETVGTDLNSIGEDSDKKEEAKV